METLKGAKIWQKNSTFLRVGNSDRIALRWHPGGSTKLERHSIVL